MPTNQTSSYHAFLFPFSIRPPENTTNFHDWFKGKIQGWKEVHTAVNESVNTYNQHVYFHDFVESALFNRPDSDSQNQTRKPATEIVRQYEFTNTGCKPQFQIFRDDSDSPAYVLRLDSLTLSVYETQVGVMTFHLYYDKPPEADETWTVTANDINYINDRGRRLFPQFLEGTDGHLTNLPKKDMMAHKIVVRNDQQVLSTECFDDYRRQIPSQIRLANHITTLLWGQTAAPPIIRPLIDDRMFVVCWWGNNEFSEQLKVAARSKGEHVNCEDWYKFVFIDGNGLSCQYGPLLTDLLSASTYSRWANYGTFSGVSRYSFVSLTDEGKLARSKLLTDIQTLYLPMVQLCLVQRASVLHFSERISTASDVSGNGDVNEITNLYQAYIRFVNRLYFREVTPQEQGIELYELMQKVMLIREEVKNLDGEMNELNQFAELQLQRRLAQVATLFLPASLVAAMLAWISDKNWFNGQPFDIPTVWMTVLFSGITLVSFAIAYRYFFKTRIRNHS